MMITHILNLLYREGADKPLLSNLIALELLKPDTNNLPFPLVILWNETTCYFQAGIISYTSDQHQSISTPFHLAHTGSAALIVDAKTGQVLTDLWFDTQIIMIREEKQAIFFHSRTPQGIAMIRLEEPRIFNQWRKLMPSTLLMQTIEEEDLLPTHGKEGAIHV